MPKLILDASSLIALMNSGDRHHHWAVGVFTQTLDYDLVIPALTLAEAMVHPVRAGKLSQFERSVEKLGLTTSAMLADSAAQLAALRAKTNLKMPDCVVLHEALLARKADALTAIATTDNALAIEAVKAQLTVFAPR